MAVVREIDGQLVLDDPGALAIIRAVGKSNCKKTLYMGENPDRVEHFANRMKERGETGEKVVIVIINVDDVHGGPVTEILMPGQGAMWQDFRNRDEIPIARGLAMREGIQQVLDDIDPEAAKKLKTLVGFAVVVIDHGVAEVWKVNEV